MRLFSAILSALAALLLSASGARAQLILPIGEAPLDYFVNRGEIGCDTNIFPQINALTVNNEGSFCIGTTTIVAGTPFFVGGSTLPYEFSNLRNFVNSGVIQAAPGIWFNAHTDAGRGFADSFVNTGLIAAQDTLSGFVFVEQNSYNMIWADEIRNKGAITAGGGGLIQLRGRNVIITNSAIATEATFPIGCVPFDSLSFLQQLTSTNFFGENSFQDVAWGSEVRTNAPSSIFSGGAVVTPPTLVTNSAGFPNIMRINLPQPLAWGLTNQLDDTNFAAQAVFVQTSSSEVQVDVRWIPLPVNPFDGFNQGWQTAIVRLFQPFTNLVTGLRQTNQIFILDSMALTTNYAALTNENIFGQRPAPLFVTRTLPCEFDTLPIGNVTNDFGTDVALLEQIFNVPNVPQITTNTQVGYRFLADPPFTAPFGPPIPPSITNSVGRVEIIADRLDMTRARIRGEGLVDIKAQTLVGSSRARVDSINYNLNLGHPTQLNVTDIVPPFVPRMHTLGSPVHVWSGVWTNVQETAVVTPDTNNPAGPGTTNILTTNFVFHALVVDARSIITQIPTLVHQFHARAELGGPSVVRINDTLRIQEEFSIQARNIIINNEISFDASHLNWNSETVPFAENVWITATGQLNVFDLANLGGDRRYITLTNQGSIFGNFGVRINTGYFENAGDIFSGGLLAVVADRAQIDGRFLLAQDDLTFTNRVLTIAEVTAEVSGNIILNVSESLFDHPTRANEFTADGIQLVRRPAAGDFMGSSVILEQPNFGLSENIWASTRNLGASAAGFVENLAIGQLVLEGGNGSLYVFQAPDSAPTAIYVDLLEISPQVAADLEGSIAIAPNVTIYFADVRGASLDEMLNTQFPGGGRFEWVSSFASARSGVDFTLPSGETITINRLLGEQDDDQDGTPNQEDPDWAPRTQLTGLSFNRGGNSFSFSWIAPAKSVTYLETSDNPRGGNWQIVKSYPNTFFRSRAFTSDSFPTEGTRQRYYRVRVVK